jgi:hypothetical protein
MTNEQEIVRSVFDAYIKDAKATSTKKDRPTFDMLEEVKNRAIKVLGQSISDDCVSRKFMYELGATCIAARNKNGKLIALGAIENLPPVTPAQCIAAVRFSKDDLREICNERIEIECTHGTCKDCKLYRPDQYRNMRCQVLDFYPSPDFYCADFEKRGSEE